MLKLEETITDTELQARTRRSDPKKLISAFQIVTAAEGHYVKIWLDGLLYYMTPTRPRTKPRYWRRLPSLISHVRGMCPCIKEILLIFEEDVIHKPKKRLSGRL